MRACEMRAIGLARTVSGASARRSTRFSLARGDRANGEPGLRIALPVAPALIVLDLMMPVMDGHAFLRHRAGDPALGEVPVVVLTAQSEAPIEHRHEVVDVIAKPVMLGRLFSVIRAIVGRARPANG